MTIEEKNKVIKDNIDGLITREEAASKLNKSISQYKRYKSEFVKNGSLNFQHKGCGNTNAKKYDDEQINHLVASYIAESGKVQIESNGKRKARKLKVFINCYNEDYKCNIPYTTGKFILYKSNIISPISRMSETHTNSIALIDNKKVEIPGFEFQADGSFCYRFPNDNIDVTAHVVVEASSSMLVGLYFDIGETNKGYKHAFRYAFVRHGLPELIITDGRTSFFNVAKIDEDTKIGKMLKNLGIRLKTTSNCNRNNKVENSHDPIRDYIFDQMLIDGIKTFEEANEVIGKYIDRYNKLLSHSIDEDNVLNIVPEHEIDEAFLELNIRSLSNKYTLNFNNNTYFVVRNNTILQKRAKTKICIYTDIHGLSFVKYGGNIYELIEATKENLKNLNVRQETIEKVIVRKNGYDFKYDNKYYHIIDSIGNPVVHDHRSVVTLSTLNKKIFKARTCKGIFNVLEGKVNIPKENITIIERKISYQQTIDFSGDKFVLLDSSGSRKIIPKSSSIEIVVKGDKAVAAIYNGETLMLFNTKTDPLKYRIPTSHYAAKKMFEEML